jgi:hypothetical protein
MAYTYIVPLWYTTLSSLPPIAGELRPGSPTGSEKVHFVLPVLLIAKRYPVNVVKA